jgi:hypothetical protein
MERETGMNTSLSSVVCVILVASALAGARSDKPTALEVTSLTIKDAEGHSRGYFGMGPEQTGEVTLSLDGIGDVNHASRIRAALIGDRAVFDMTPAAAPGESARSWLSISTDKDGATIDMTYTGQRVRIAARHDTGLISLSRAVVGPGGHEDGSTEMVFHVPN